ncbi:MAG: hypothetical protein K2X93_05890 [Candidatus Obscuribacterales bacterium]|nr:hypothetical protein [Candidatus Obscuribacterales bacterium]
MYTNIEKMFQKIGAEVRVVAGGDRRGRFIRAQRAPVTLDIIEDHGKESFEIAISSSDDLNTTTLLILEVIPEDRHLVLLARQTDKEGRVLRKDHFLCGHDERHLFVAAVTSVSTVAAAKASLKPIEVRDMESGLNTKKRNRRKTKVFKRQGEWFFIPDDIEPGANQVRKNEPLSRGRGSKPHMAQFAFRVGGVPAKVCNEFPKGLTEEEFNAELKINPRIQYLNWTEMQRDATVYVKGKISHADHATITLNSWHRVLMNTERPTESVVFLD